MMCLLSLGKHLMFLWLLLINKLISLQLRSKGDLQGIKGQLLLDLMIRSISLLVRDLTGKKADGL